MIKETIRPQVTAYECMLLICSGLVEKGKTVLRQDTLVSLLYNFRNNPETKVLFGDVAFKKNLDTIISLDIEDSLSKLQTFGAIGKLNPAYEKIVLYISQDEAHKFIERFGEECAHAIDVVCEVF